MSEKKSSMVDVRPKAHRSRSADSYVWNSKKRLKKIKSGTSTVTDADGAAKGTCCSKRNRRERKYSSSSVGDLDSDNQSPSRKALTGRSLRQKLQDAMGQCFPLRSHHQTAGSRSFSVMLWSKRKIHVSELMQEKCPFSPKSELARCWHLIKKHPVQHMERQAGDRDSLLHAPVPPLISWRKVDSQTVPCESEESDEELSGPSATSAGQECAGHLVSDSESICTYFLVPDLLQISNSTCYWGVLDRYEAEALLEGKPEGTFLLRDSAQEDFLFSVSFRRYSRSLHARIEHSGHFFSFDWRDPCVYRDPSVTGLIQHYSDPATCLFFEPLLSMPLPRNFPFSLQHLCRAVVCSQTTYQGVDALPLPNALREYLKEYHYKHKTDSSK
ncbi:SOCS4 protein, partial [Polypterus senegalus]|nr:suppressor of cytokine signaling 4 [Polypterus senegalus]XP_039597938.1 suppressor of cytokine signaling 4 [Polypterus senegalus]XP_039597939.1 suppressor of cytokine signaling 4 [Polypterus senegalus]XP_039597940.1 suppressor of cytokine signaling 4 [Polypterus senegalus]MBN3290940.1 SOCS4 protein [Polypterus senegalus]